MNLITPGSTPNPTNTQATPGSVYIQPSTGTTFTFAAGQMIKATVQQIINSVVWLKAEGQVLQARTETPLQVGQQVQLKVIEVGPSKVNLQLENSTLPSPLIGGEKGGVEILLASWGLAIDQANVAIAQALLTLTQTLQFDDIQDIRAQWQTLSSSPQLATTDAEVAHQQLEALTFLHTHQLPVSRESLALAQNWLNGLPPLSKQLTELQMHLDDALWQLYRAKGNEPALEQLQDTLLAAHTALAKWSVLPERSGEQISRSLNQIITQIGTPVEAELALAIPDAVEPSPPPLPLETPTGKVMLALKAETEATPLANPLHRLASVLTAVLAHRANLDEPTLAVLHRLADQLNQFSDDLSALHLANINTPHNQLVEPYYFFPIPVSTPDGLCTAQLKVYQQPGQEEVDPQNMRLALLLDLPSLGEIAIDLTVFERHLSGHILSRRDETHHLIETEVGTLQLSLSNLGYQVDALSCDLLKHPTLNVPHTRLNAERAIFNGLDLSA